MPSVRWGGVKHAVFSGVMNHALLAGSLIDETGFGKCQGNATYQNVEFSAGESGVRRMVWGSVISSQFGRFSGTEKLYLCYSIQRHFGTFSVSNFVVTKVLGKAYFCSCMFVHIKMEELQWPLQSCDLNPAKTPLG